MLTKAVDTELAMTEKANPYLTLPTVVASMVGEAKRQELLLTIVFHPDTARIGETSVVCKPKSGKHSVIGRNSPKFGRNRSSARPIADRYISRTALDLWYVRGAIVLRRGPSSSRANVGSNELIDEVQLSDEKLCAGVPIVLGGRVVLMLRRVDYFASLLPPVLASDTLRGSSVYMKKLREQIQRLASTNLDLLIRGETGTGKELVAQAVHCACSGASGNMISVNMAAIPVSLAPGILFGTAKGAFSGASKSTAGYFEQAEGGTLFLDEIGDTPPEIQAQLLRALQQREIQCVGGPLRKVSLRVVSATDAPLEEESCNFKAALRHRLGESEISLLPLRQHPEDIGELAFSFLAECLRTQRRENLLPSKESAASELARWAELFYQFVCYSWPGNIRELGNFAQQVAVASDTNLIIPDTVLDRLSELEPVAYPGSVVPAELSVKGSAYLSEEDFIAQFEAAEFEVARAAREIGISRQAVYRRIADIPSLCLASELPAEKIEAALQYSAGDIALAAAQLRVSRTALRARIGNTARTLAG